MLEQFSTRSKTFSCLNLQNLNVTTVSSAKIGNPPISVVEIPFPLSIAEIKVQHNQLSSLKELSVFKNMIKLNCSHNQLTSFLDFLPLMIEQYKNKKWDETFLFLYLQELDCSMNQISTLLPHDLMRYCKFLQIIDLSNNQLTEIDSLQELLYVKTINLNSNQISNLQPLSKLSLKHLFVNENQLQNLEGIPTTLVTLHCKRNPLQQLQPLQTLTHLFELDVRETVPHSEDDIRSLVSILQQLSLFRVLWIQDEFSLQDEVTLTVLYQLQNLSEMNGHKLTAEDKVRALIHFGYENEMKQKVLEKIFHAKETHVKPESTILKDPFRFRIQQEEEKEKQQLKTKSPQKKLGTTLSTLFERQKVSFLQE